MNIKAPTAYCSSINFFFRLYLGSSFSAILEALNIRSDITSQNMLCADMTVENKQGETDSEGKISFINAMNIIKCILLSLIIN